MTARRCTRSSTTASGQAQAAQAGEVERAGPQVRGGAAPAAAELQRGHRVAEHAARGPLHVLHRRPRRLRPLLPPLRSGSGLSGDDPGVAAGVLERLLLPQLQARPLRLQRERGLQLGLRHVRQRGDGLQELRPRAVQRAERGQPDLRQLQQRSARLRRAHAGHLVHGLGGRPERPLQGHAGAARRLLRADPRRHERRLPELPGRGVLGRRHPGRRVRPADPRGRAGLAGLLRHLLAGLAPAEPRRGSEDVQPLRLQERLRLPVPHGGGGSLQRPAGRDVRLGHQPLRRRSWTATSRRTAAATRFPTRCSSRTSWSTSSAACGARRSTSCGRRSSSRRA